MGAFGTNMKIAETGIFLKAGWSIGSQNWKEINDGIVAMN
jgi:hypothetical protein